MVHEKNRHVSVCVQELSSTRFSLNSCSHSGISEHNGSHRSVSWFSFLLGFGILVRLVKKLLLWDSRRTRVSPFLPFNTCAWHKHWMGIYPTQVFPCSSLTVAWPSHGWWGRRAWGRYRMINLLSWRCHGCWREKTGGWTRWQARNHDRNEVLCSTVFENHFQWDVFFDRWSTHKNIRFHRKAFRAEDFLLVDNVSNSLTKTVTSSCVCTSPLAVMTIVGLHDFVKVSISAEFKSFLLIMCIDAPESTTKSRSSSLWFYGAGTPFPKVRRMLLFHAPWISEHFWPTSTLLHGHLALAILSLPETDPQILEHWGYADEDHLGKSFQAMDFGLKCQPDVRRLSWISHVGLVSVCLSSSAKSMKTSAAPYPEIRNPIVVYLMSCTQQVLGARDVCHGKQRVSPFYRTTHASSAWPLHFWHLF